MLRRTHLIDCHGRTTHTLTLLPTGRVEIDFAGGTTAEVDPRTRTCLTPGVTIPGTLWPEIGAVAAP